MAALGRSGRGVAAVLPPARCWRRSCRDRQPPLKTPPRGSSRGCLATLLTCLQVRHLTRRDRTSPAWPPPAGMLLAASAGLPRAGGAMLAGPRGKHPHQAQVAVVAFVSSKNLVAVEVPPACSALSSPGQAGGSAWARATLLFMWSCGAEPHAASSPWYGAWALLLTPTSAAAFLLFPSYRKLRQRVMSC